MNARFGLRIANCGLRAELPRGVGGTDKSVFVGASASRVCARRMMPHARGAMILVVVLLIITLLALVAGTFSFRMQADLAAVQARQDLLQAEQAARAGIDRVVRLLRDQRTDIDKWYNNPNAFRRILVCVPGDPDKIGGSESLADQEPVPGRPAWRFSIISYMDNGTGQDQGNTSVKIRYGITDEASKINLNTASRSQLLTLFDLIKPEHVTSEQLADALIDWRDQNDQPISSSGAESSYYMTLNPPYRAKNRPLDTVEELLMVKGFNGQILFGEDYNRNGYLDPNEDDGPDGLFPPDNGDGKLDRGLLAYVTVYSWDWNLSNDNKRRLDLNSANFSQTDKLPEWIQQEIKPEILKFIADAQQRKYRFRSVGELVGLQVYEDGRSNYDQPWRDYIRDIARAGRVQAERTTNDSSASDQGNSADEQGTNGGQDNNTGNNRRNGNNDSGNNNGNDGGNNRNNNNDNGSNNNNGSNDSNNSGNDSRSNSNSSRDSQNRNGGSGGNQDNTRGRGSSNNNGGNNSKNSSRRNQGIRWEGGRSSGFDRCLADPWSGFRIEPLRGASQMKILLVAGQSGGNSRGGSGRGFNRNQNDNQNRRGGRNNQGGSNTGSGNQDDQNQGNDFGNQNDGSQDDSGNNNNRRGGRRGNRNPQNDNNADNGNGGNNSENQDNGDQGGRGGRRRGGPGQGNNQGPNAGNGGFGGAGPATGTQPAGRGTPIESPVVAEDLPILMDRLTANPVPALAGLINVNTAPPIVLKTIPGLTDEQVDAIVAKRQGLDGFAKATPAWLVTQGAVDPTTFALISNQVTTRSIQFSIDSIGFADHVGAFKRIQAVIEMRGQISQIKYYRDISALGMGYPVHDDQRSDGFAFSN